MPCDYLAQRLKIRAKALGPYHPDVAASKKPVEWSSEVDFEKFIPANLSLPEVLSGVEEQMVKRALRDAGFVQARAAESLGITKSLLQYKMKKYHLQKK